ncbi:MAG: DUF4258 domain-containing protein [Planctomycetes bacterium]|nr:DUF4258 domain-containing protein [Planctomycetota bacterium]
MLQPESTPLALHDDLKVYWTGHALARLEERGIPRAAIFEVLRKPFQTGRAPAGAHWSLAAVVAGARRIWLKVVWTEAGVEDALVLTAYCPSGSRAA